MTDEIGNSALLRTWANDGTVAVPPEAKINEGWLRGEQPPHEWMNYIHNILGQKINHALSRGAADWVNTTEYLSGALVNRSGVLWVAVATNTDSAPSDANSNWKRVIQTSSPVLRSIVRSATSGTYTPDAEVRAILVKIVGGGGGGRGPSGASGQAGIAAGGGGAGGYAEKYLLVSALTVPETVTIGAGGAGGAAGSNNGVAGGTTSFGAHLMAGGGGLGANAGGDGGVGSGGDINARGGSGSHRAVDESGIAYSGNGGDSRLAGGGRGSGAPSAGADGGLGSGGGGGRSNNAGGKGGDGYVEIWEFV